jgi:hypothetical protein
VYLKTDYSDINNWKNNETNIEYAAAYMAWIQDIWREAYLEIDGRTAILATLYNNRGHEKTPHSNPVSNDFGNTAKENYYHVLKLLGLS